MKYTAFLFLNFILLTSCVEKHAYQKVDVKYDRKKHFSPLSLDENIPVRVKEILGHAKKEKHSKYEKFKIAYYLIPQFETEMLFPSAFSSKLRSDLSHKISSAKHHMLFVPPHLEEHYSNLKNSYRYISPEETDFYAANINEDVMVLWPKKSKSKSSFIITAGTQDFVERFPASLDASHPKMTIEFLKKNKNLKGQSIYQIEDDRESTEEM